LQYFIYSYEEITLEDDPFFEIELMYGNKEFVSSDESSLDDDDDRE
jgi:hypothetical protein